MNLKHYNMGDPNHLSVPEDTTPVINIQYESVRRASHASSVIENPTVFNHVGHRRKSLVQEVSM